MLFRPLLCCESFFLHVGFTRFCPLFHFNWLDLKGYLSFGLFQIGEKGAYYVGQRSDQMLIGFFFGADALGYYSFAFNLVAQPLSRINPVLTSVAFPVFSQVPERPREAQKGLLEARRHLNCHQCALADWPCGGCPLGRAPTFGAELVRKHCARANFELRTLLRSINNPAGSLLYAKGRVGLTLVWHIVTLLLSVPVRIRVAVW